MASPNLSIAVGMQRGATMGLPQLASRHNGETYPWHQGTTKAGRPHRDNDICNPEKLCACMPTEI
eukprot:9148205-Pyramimonas_sp.AAC.1